ncbi:unnamed protein product [Moneuplotes crassus]|uniref:Uncharacterized protein n=1 Tax=Euplotes crassus TaxID=5936 RepID=A0AAD1U5L7_EUPCR|nr:unnamed protein product [Moneuplotes crassus]
MNIKQGLQKFLNNYSGKKIIGEEIIPFKALVIEVLDLMISDGEYKIPAIYSEECRKEFNTKFEYLKLSELRNMNIMVNNYEYILHDPQAGDCGSYKGMIVKIVIHSIKPLPNEAPLNSAGKDILLNKFVKAGLEKYKYKRMQGILMASENTDYPMEVQEQSQSQQMRIEGEQSKMSGITSNLSSLIAIFDDKMELSHKKEQTEVSQNQSELIQSIFNLNTGKYLEDDSKDQGLFHRDAHQKEFTFTRLINLQRQTEAELYARLNEKYIQEMQIEDKRQCRMKEESLKYENKQKALKYSLKDLVVQRINKTMNKPSESNVHQRGNIDLNSTFEIKEGIKQVIENEILKRMQDSDQESDNGRPPIQHSKSKKELKNHSPEEVEETGSLLAISEFKSYMEWYYLKKHNQEENQPPEESTNSLDASTVYNTDAKPCTGIKSIKNAKNTPYEVQNSENLQQIRTMGNPENFMKDLENSSLRNHLSGIKRNATSDGTNPDIVVQGHKRKCMNEESQNKLAQLFRQKQLSRQNRSLDFQEEGSEGSEVQPPLSEIKAEAIKPDTKNSHESSPRVINYSTLLRNEEDLPDSSNPGGSAHEVTSYNVNTPMRSEISSQVLNSSMYSKMGKGSTKSSKYCGKRRNIELKRDKKCLKQSMHEKLAKCFYFQP